MRCGLRRSSRCRTPRMNCCWRRSKPTTQGGTARWLLPLAIVWEERPTGPLPAQLALARVRRGARVGLLTDGFALPEFARAVMAGLADGTTIATQAGEIRFEPTSRMAETTVPPDAEMQLAVGRTVELLADHRRRRDAEAVPPHRGGTASRGGDGPLPDRAGLCQYRAPAGRDGPGRSRRRPPRPGDRARFHPQPGRCVDLDARSADARPVGSDSRHRGGAGDRPSSTRTTMRSPRCSAGGSAKCMRCWPATPTIRRSRRRPAGVETAEQWAAQAEQQLAAAFAALDAQKEWDEAAAQDLAAVTSARERLVETVRELARAGPRRDADAHPWRSASGPGAGRQRRCLHHRLRGRAGEADGVAAREEPSTARCRRHDPLVRLCRRGGEAEKPRQPGARRRPEP